MTRTHRELLRRLAMTILVWFALTTGVLAQEHPVALAGGTVHTVSGKPITGGVVVMQHGKIIAVGRSVPDGAERVDLSGRHLYPGLMDADSVLGLVEIGAVRATRDMVEVGEITPNVRAEHAVNPDSTLLPVARANGITYVRTAPRGGLIA
ncbi:MAG: amidohydrolase, partial [Acidobacteria bacterium]